MEILLAACSPHLRLSVIVAIHTGMRAFESLKLMWQDIDFGAKTLAVRQAKNNEPRLIPMNQTRYEELRRYRSSRGICTLLMYFAMCKVSGTMR